LWRTDGRPARTAISSERGRRGRGKVRQGVDDSPRFTKQITWGKGKEAIRIPEVICRREERDWEKGASNKIGERRIKAKWPAGMQVRWGKNRVTKNGKQDVAKQQNMQQGVTKMIGDEERRRAVVGIVTSLSQKRASMTHWIVWCAVNDGDAVWDETTPRFDWIGYGMRGQRWWSKRGHKDWAHCLAPAKIL